MFAVLLVFPTVSLDKIVMFQIPKGSSLLVFMVRP